MNEDVPGLEPSEEQIVVARTDRVGEVETGPLLPLWLSVTLYILFAPWCVFSLFWIGRSMVVQQSTLGILKRASGPWEGEAPAMDSPAMQKEIEFLRQTPRQSLLYVVQDLCQEEISDPRMARAVSLRKATQWSVESKRRLLFAELLANIEENGEMPLDYRLAPEHAQTLQDFLAERRAHPTTSYEDNKVTEVLQWIADGRPTPPKGPERRRVKSLETGYEKKLFFGTEKRTLKALMKQWRTGGNSQEAGAAAKFERMLEGEHAELSPAERKLCEERADRWEQDYLKGRERLSHLAVEMVKAINATSVRMDHPDIWDMAQMLEERHDPARKNLMEAVSLLKERRFTFLYLSQFIQRATVNPVLAMETTRLTKDEHETLLIQQNHRRRAACIEVLERIATDYCNKPFTIEGIAADKQKEFFLGNTVETFSAVVEDRQDREVGAQAQQALSRLQELCASLP